MGITNTEFYAHQYKPLLTLLESPAEGLLIADEVGLGKTFLAGEVIYRTANINRQRVLIVAHPGTFEALLPHVRYAVMKAGAILANAGHFNVELELSALRSLAVSVRTVRPNVGEYTLEGGRRIYLLAEGRLVNLVAAEGHPAAVLDISLASHALAAEHVVARAHELGRHVYEVPGAIDREVARLKLETLGIAIDTLTEEQRRYLSSWDQAPSP